MIGEAGMNRAKIGLLVLALVILTGIVTGYAYHIRVAAWLWHLRHGAAMSVGTYTVPVPTNWYVESQSGGDQLLIRADTANQTPSNRPKAHATILLLIEPPSTDEQLNRSLALDREFLKQHGVDPVLQRTFKTDGETISCVGGEKPGSGGVFDVEPVSWRCASAGGLQIITGSTDSDIAQIWDIVSGIRKRS
jgi:hypothetical protein